ncbi:MAG: hypothetical protein ATN31_04375 [Candidatus Epulonipiscioides saccharophilum]|nr:MAG: hypothetical protein ATN31_04375 [Epulopiscium sp. AS2M-Bin001]
MHPHLTELTDYFKENRSEGFIYRINGKNKYIEDFLISYYTQAKISGIILESKIQTPTGNNLRYFKDCLGSNFTLSHNFIEESLKIWLINSSIQKRTLLAKHLYETLMMYQNIGKNLNIIQNTYIKFMCWAYFRFQRVLNVTTNGQKVLYIGAVSKHEIEFLSILAFCGVDILVISLLDEARYNSLDPTEQLSYLYNDSAMINFGSDYRINNIEELIERKIKAEMERNIIKNYSNEWVDGDAFLGLNTKTSLRSAKPGYFNNIFICFKGADDTVTFAKKLNSLYRHIENTNRPYIIENKIPTIWPNEISVVKRRMTIVCEDDLIDLGRNIEQISPVEYLQSARNIFTRLVKEIYYKEDRLNMATNKIIQFLALYKRYESTLFATQDNYPPIFILFGSPHNEIEVIFLKFLSKLYVDILIILPDPNELLTTAQQELFKDPNLCVIEYNEKLNLTEYPKTLDNLIATTNAYQAERVLDDLLYKDTGLYRQHQMSRANSLTLKTTCEEIDILWPIELKFRPGFSTEDDIVCMPVIFAKISGVKNENIKDYYARVQSFIIPKNTMVCVEPPFIKNEDHHLFATTTFIQDSRLLKNEIKQNRNYKFGHLREDIQDHLLNKIELLINSKIIDGTGTRGTEYKILQVLLNLDENFLKHMQKFDFTKQNPKIVVIHTKQKMHSIEDAIFLAYANLVGCDIIIISPTGYRSFERFYTKPLIQEHHDGEYLYDLSATSILERPKDKPKNFLKKMERMIKQWQ